MAETIDWNANDEMMVERVRQSKPFKSDPASRVEDEFIRALDRLAHAEWGEA